MRSRMLLMLLLASTSAVFADPATGWLQTAAGTYDYNDPANWVNGEINGIFGSDLTLAGAQTLTLGADTVLSSGLEVDFGGGYTLTFASDDTAITRTLTLGGDVDAAASAKNAGLTFAPSLIVDLGGVERTVYTTSGNFGVTFNGTIQNGALALHNAGWLTLAGNNTYAGGTTTLGAGGISINSNTAFGTGTITFSAPNTTLQCDTTDRTLPDNPIVFNGNINAALNSNRARNFGAGEITIVKPITLSVGKNTLSFLGPIAADSPYGWEAVSKTGGGTLVTAGVMEFASDDITLDVQQGTWQMNGSLSGNGNLVKTGGGILALNAINTFTGDLIVQGGSVQFLTEGALPEGAKLVLRGGGFSGTSAYSVTTLLNSGALVAESGAKILLLGNDNGNYDFSAYPELGMGANGNRKFTGTLRVADGATLRLGGGTGYFTLDGNNVIPGNTGKIEILGKVTFSGLNDAFSGPIHVQRGATLELLGANGAFPNSDIEADRGTVYINLNTQNCPGRVRAHNIRLRTSKFQYQGTKLAPTSDSISGDLILDVASARPDICGGINFLEFKAATHPATFIANKIVYTNGAVASISGPNLGLSDSGETPRFMLLVPPTLIGGGGADGTPTISIDPYLHYNGNSGNYEESLVTYGPNGYRGLNLETEYASELPVGEVTALNVRIPATTTAVNSAETTINSLFLQGIERGGDTILNGDAVLHVTSGAVGIGYHRYTRPEINAPIDFGSNPGVISFVKGKGSYWRGAIHGTAGAIFFQGSELAETYSGGTGLTIEWDSALASTISGDIVVHGYLFTRVPMWERSEDRPLRFHVYGAENNQTSSAERLDGNGRVIRAGNATFTFGYDNTDALYEGSLEGSARYTKVGTGTQRLTGTSTHNQLTTVAEGTLQLDGSFTESAITVAEDATLAGCGSVTKAVTLQAGATLALGSDELPEDLAFEFGNTLTFGENTTLTFLAHHHAPTTAAIVQGNVLGTDVTVQVLPQGDGYGEWLLLEAPSIAPTFQAAPRTGRIERRLTDSGEQIWFRRTRGIVLLFR